MTNNFLQDSILYYPTIEIQNETWLKSALTFWDTVYRIVPAGYHPNDSYEVTIAKEAGLLRDINLTSKDLESAAEDFENFCEEVPFVPAGMDSSTYEVRLHSDKIDDRLKPFFA